VQAVLDESNNTAKYSAATFLLHAGIPTFIDAKHAIAHNKIIIIDGRTVITGSFNFTKAAEERNAENLLILRDALSEAPGWTERGRCAADFSGRQRGTARTTRR
jgi:phosphatidylserine/phosphatidylglycerophosphate/cardiolipin synthase-like enzyme